MPLKAVVASQGNTKILERMISPRIIRAVFFTIILIHWRHDFAVSHQRFVVWAEVHIADEFTISQALIASVDIRAALATNNMFFYLHFWHPVYEILYLDTDKMQHLGQAILIHCVAQAFFVILIFKIVVKYGNAIQHQAN